ncbi:MBOAT-2 domain-containing protein [Mycena sanguinolenta]|uniref:MBOAT-2 domain-containing protein n=1 Tax=Mycena sanguinolenta TaxID=230812 RepID=A0A8H6ZCZ8_9AGAR|nr:MBOAT-2 domain-containing protein [Mycena sanguinolenta]
MSSHVSIRSPLTFASFFHTFVPPPLLYYLLNVLAILGPTTFVYRLALLPVILFMSYRAAVSLDIARGFLSINPGRLEYLNQAMVLAMFIVCMRSLVRTFSSQIPRRKETRNRLALDAADLTFNLRSVGWNLSAGMKVGPMRPLVPSAYLVATARSLAIHVLIFDCLHYICQILAPVGGVYDMTISDPFLRSVRSTVVTILVGLCIHSAIQIGGDAFGIIGVGLIGQSSSEWPPIFDSPWLATSLTDFWAARWHQLFRQDFLALGAKPLTLVAGRPGGVLGAFLVSGILHYVGLWGMGRGTDVRVIYFFLVMGVGVILEGFWKRLTGSRVSGWMGWIWSCVWIVGWGPLMADPWCISGIMASVFVPPPVRPSVWLHRLATNIYITFS